MKSETNVLVPVNRKHLLGKVYEKACRFLNFIGRPNLSDDELNVRMKYSFTLK